MKLNTLLAGFIILAVGAASAEQARRLGVERAFATAARGSGLSFARIEIDSWRGIVQIFDIAGARGGASFRLAELAIPLPPMISAIASEAHAQGSSARVTDIIVAAGSSTYKIRSIEIVGASLSSSDLAKWFETGSTLALAERLLTLSAATIAIPEMTIETHLDGTTQSVFYRDLLLSGVAKGQASEVRAAGASFSIADPAHGEIRGAYGLLVAKSFDLALAARMLDEEALDEALAQKKPLYAGLEIEGAHAEGKDFALDAATLRAAAVQGRPLRKATQTQGSEASRRLDMIAADDLVASEVRLELRAAEPAQRLAVARIAAHRLDDARIDAVDASAIEIISGARRVLADRATLKGVDLGTAATAGALGADASSRVDAISASGIAVRPAIGDDSPANLGALFTIAHIDLKNTKGENRTGLDIVVDHAVLPAASALPALAAMGYATIDVTGQLAAVWTSTANELSIDRFSLRDAAMGVVEASALLGDVTPDLASADSQAAQNAARKVVLKRFDVNFLNQGLVDKALAAQARSQELSVDEARQANMMKATLLLPALMGNTPALRLIGSELAKFIADPKTFALTMRSEQGVGLRDLELVATPAALMKKLEIAAYANRMR